MGRLSNLKEAIFGVPEKKEVKEGRAVLGDIDQDYGVRLPTNFRSQAKIYNEDPCIKESILQMAQEVCSTGFFTTISKDYNVVLPKPEGDGNWSAKQAVDYFNKENDMDAAQLLIAIELIAFGNSFWHIQNGFTHIPIEAIQQVSPRTKTTPIYKEYNLKLTQKYKAKVIPWGEFIHFRTNISGYAPLGTGIILGLIAQPDNETPSLYTIRKSVRASMDEGFRKFSFGNELWVFDGLADDKIEEMSENIAKMKSTGKRICTNVKGDIKLAIPQRTQSYDKWIEQIRDEFYMSLGNPSLKLGLEQGFTKATSETAKELYEMKIASLRRIIKRLVEAVWNKVLTEWGFDAEKAQVRLNFGSEEVEYEVKDILTAEAQTIITKEEARKLLREYAKWKLEEESGEEVEPNA